VRKFDSFDDQRCQQIKDWQALGGSARRQAAWELVVDYGVGMKGMNHDELRLQRSVTKLMKAFLSFGVPMIGVTEEDFATPKTQFSIGVPPCEIDFLTSIPGLDFLTAWNNKVASEENDFPHLILRKIRPHHRETNSRSPPRPRRPR
jgi:hypothetical protein